MIIWRSPQTLESLNAASAGTILVCVARLTMAVLKLSP